MNVYKKMYYDLFNHVTDVILDLKAAQQAVEKMYLAVGSDDNGESSDSDSESDDESNT